ncbi:MAG: hypothetical protein AAFR62_13495 [Cyanobacteria bacterium J06629_2]
MNEKASLLIAAVFGLVAGMSHGVVSHYQELPFSLSQQVIESISGESFN